MMVSYPNGSRTRSQVDESRSAQARTQEAAQAFLEGPIAAVEMKDDIFNGLRNTRIGDAESWRRFIQSAPIAERAYLGQVHELLRQMAEEGKGKEKNAWLYNFRTKACLFYDLGGTA